MFKEEKYMILKVLSVLIAISALAASAAGIVSPGIYNSLVPEREIPFIFAQDIVSFIASILLFALTFTGKNKNAKLDIIRTGTVGFLFYAYGPYVMGTLYNYFYFLYISIFGLTIFYFINAFTCIEYERLEPRIPGSLRIVIAVYCAVIAVFFAPQWISAILKNIQTGLRPETGGFAFNYYVYILDLCFVLPVCAAASVFLFGKKILGVLLGGMIAVKGFTLMLSVALGFVCLPLFQQNPDPGNVALFSILSLVFLVLSTFYFIFTKIKKADA